PRQRRVRHRLVRRHHEERLAQPAAAEEEETVVEGQPTVGIGQIILGLAVGLGYQDAARDAPDVGFGPAPDGLAALDVALPVPAEIPAVEAVAGRSEERRGGEEWVEHGD